MPVLPQHYKIKAVHNALDALLLSVGALARCRERLSQADVDDILRQSLDDMDNNNPLFFSDKKDFEDLKDHVIRSWEKLNLKQ